MLLELFKYLNVYIHVFKYTLIWYGIQYENESYIAVRKLTRILSWSFLHFLCGRIFSEFENVTESLLLMIVANLERN